MNIVRFIPQSLLTVCISLLLIQCTITTTKKKHPLYSTDTKSLFSDITGLIPTQEISIDGSETNTNGKIVSELTITLWNPEQIPTDTTDVDQIARQIAITVKQALKNSESFNYYKVLFTNRQTDKGLTQTKSLGRTYKYDDMKNYAYMVTLGDTFDSSISRGVGKSAFNENDTEIVSVLTYYDLDSNITGQVKIFKETDTAVLLLTTRNLGKLISGHEYLVNKWKVADFYGLEGLKTGNYRVEYFIRDTLIGSKSFTLL